MKKHNGFIDILKFCFAIIIIFYHAGHFYGPDNNKLCADGYIAVEFFFIVSGYLMAKKAYAISGSTNISTMNIEFIKKKYFDLFPYFFLAIITSFIVYHMVLPSSGGVILHDFLFTIPELFCLQMLGFPGYWATGVSWYLSAMFFSMFFLYPCLLKWKDKFTLIIAPILVIYIYGYFAFSFVNVNTPDLWMGFIYKGLLRAVAGISLGCVCFKVSEKLKTYDFTAIGKGLITSAELFGYITVMILTFSIKTSGYLDYIMILLLFFSISISFSQKSVLSSIKSNKFSNFLGQLSIVIFLNHYYWAANMLKIFPNTTADSRLKIYLLISFITAIVNYLVVNFLRKINLKTTLKNLIYVN